MDPPRTIHNSSAEWDREIRDGREKSRIPSRMTIGKPAIE
jgi:hypothetical protein